MDPIFKSIKHVETVLELAVYMEQESRTFYRKWADAVGDETLRSVFAFLAQEEDRHCRRYKEMLVDSGRSLTEKEKLVGEYALFMDMLVTEAMGHLQMTDGMTPATVLDAALRFEKDTLLIFQEIAMMFDGERRGMMLAICDEEKKHIHRLLECKQDYAAKS